MSARIPRREDDDHTRSAATERLDYLRQRSGLALEHLGGYSFDPAETR